MTNSTYLAAWQQLPCPQISAAMASLGFDWLVIDAEHSSITIQVAEHCFIAAERHGCRPMVRLPQACPYTARRYLDAGAQGLIVPVVEEREGFDTFAQHCYFPPKGKRGLGLVRANLWGGVLQEYINEFEPTIIAQIETQKGANNCQQILASPYVDGIMIGPYDLSADLGCPGDFSNPDFVEICREIRNNVKNSGKMLGFHQVASDEQQLKQRLQEGYDFIAYGTDLVAMRSALVAVEQINKQ